MNSKVKILPVSLMLIFFLVLTNFESYGQVQYQVTVTANPPYAGTVEGGGSFNSETSVTVKAYAIPGYQFKNWSGGNENWTSSSYTFICTGNVNLVANFELIDPWKKAEAPSENIYYDGEGNIGIGTLNPDKKLTVNGTVHAEEVLVSAVGADFVFEDDYKLRTLEEVENYINENKHLPEIASAMEMKQNGVELGDMGTKLLQKIEELTLYAIELKKKNKELSEKIEAMKKEKRLPDNVFQK